MNSFVLKRPFAVDVSYYEPVMNWPDADPMPEHIIARATYGVRQDTEFEHHWRFCLERGIPRAAYHYWYGTPMYSGQTASDGVGDQAENFIRQIMKNGYSGKEPLWLDLEDYGNEKVANGRNYQKLVFQWLEHIERETGQVPGIYSRKDQLERMMIFGIMPSQIHKYKMWLAWYPFGQYVDKYDYLPEGTKVWPRWLKKENLVMWQYSEDGWIDTLKMKDNHQTTTFDFNVMYPGYLESLTVGEIPAPSEPPTTGENNMSVLTIKPIYSGTRMRADHNTYAAVLVSDLNSADTLECDYDWTAPADGAEVKAGDRWGHVIKRNGAPISPGWVAIIHKGGLISTVVQIGTPPPVEPPAPTTRIIRITDDGVQPIEIYFNGKKFVEAV